MQTYFAKASIGTGFKPVLNWFQSTYIVDCAYICQHTFISYIYVYNRCNRAVSAVDWNQFNKGSNPVPKETFAKYGCIDHLFNPLKSQ